jgi:3-oxoacyl-[acyl-carrier protein] reductase
MIVMAGETFSADAFDEQILVVTGAARGIGAACAETVTRAGGMVIGADLRTMADTAGTCSETRGDFIPVQTDVTDPKSVASLLAVAREHGGADVLVNVAGVVDRGSVDELTTDSWRNSVAVNLDGPFLVVREGIDQLREKGGTVVTVSSIFAQEGMADRAGYCASKAGVEGLNRALAAELGPDGIRANVVAPGFIRTPMTKPYMDDEETVRRYEELTALKRLGDPSEVADVVAFLASDAARYVTGETILVDGGRRNTV